MSVATTKRTATRRRTIELVRRIEAGGVLEALKAAGELRRAPAGDELSHLLALMEHGDTLSRLAASHALGLRKDLSIDRGLLALLDDEESSVREAAALAYADRTCFTPAIPALCREVAAEGFSGMLAELALEEWFRGAPQLAGPLLGRALAHEPDAEARARLEAIMQVPDRDLSKARPRNGEENRSGLRIGQVFLQGRIDGELREAGAGDGGGLATLTVHLSRALGRRPEIGHAVTITRAFADEHAAASHELLHEPLDEHASIERVAFGPAGYLATADMWPYRLEAERAVERTLRRLMPLDVVHLRFADVGTFAAARACRRLGIPICFTLAPDPHSVIRAAEHAGTLSRATFAEADRRDHYVFRAHLVETMLEQAEGLVLFPRPNARADLAELLGIDTRHSNRGRLRTISEGISLETLDRAARAHEADREPAVWSDLRRAIGALPRERVGLPLLISVGRFHRVKGFHRLLEAWAGDPSLFASFNLAIVGGNLQAPTGEERIVLQLLADVVARHPAAASGLLVLGHRSHDEVAELLRAARSGLDGAVAANGVYACASDKEEFGLALLESLAAGLPVVAPQTGGPATYIEDRATGFLVDTTSVGELRRGLRGAAAVRDDQVRAARASALVRSRFSIDTMAEQLASLYLDLATSRRLEQAA